MPTWCMLGLTSFGLGIYMYYGVFLLNTYLGMQRKLKVSFELNKTANVSTVSIPLTTSPPPTIVTLNRRYVNIRYKRGSMAPCGNTFKDPVQIFIMVKSALANKETRMTQRRLWANREHLGKFDVIIRYAFMLGTAGPSQIGGEALNMNAMAEATEFGDVIIGDFVDTYKNLTYKTMAGLRWALENCPQFGHYVSLDDDAYLSIPNLISYLKDPEHYPNVKAEDLPSLGIIVPKWRQFFAGELALDLGPYRRKDHPAYISYEDYPNAKYPQFLGGSIIIMTKMTVESLYKQSFYARHITIEDVFLGLMANKIGIKPIGTRGYTSYKFRNGEAQFRNFRAGKNVIAVCCFS